MADGFESRTRSSLGQPMGFQPKVEGKMFFRRYMHQVRVSQSTTLNDARALGQQVLKLNAKRGH